MANTRVREARGRIGELEARNRELEAKLRMRGVMLDAEDAALILSWYDYAEGSGHWTVESDEADELFARLQVATLGLTAVEEAADTDEFLS